MSRTDTGAPAAPDPTRIARVTEATWPPARAWRAGPWMLRDGAGGGKRVSAATLEEADFTQADIAAAEAEMARIGQRPLFMVRAGEDALDAALEAAGHAVIDPVMAYAAPVATLAAEPLPRVSAFHIWPPLAIQRDIWAEGGIGPARLDVMARVKGPKTAILARHADQPAGTGFAAIHQNVAMVHAIEVRSAYRRQGVGTNILRAAAHWAQDQGAEWLSLLVTRANVPANGLYASLGMKVVGNYHYRIK